MADDHGEMKVTKQMLISFAIGKYKDEVLYDVVPMQAGHMLLGQPWEFNRDVTYIGKTNRYFLMYNRRKINLLPMAHL